MDQEELKSLLHYDPKTGIFTWKERRGPRAAKGSVAGSKHNDGYIAIGLNKMYYLAHRLAWLYQTGSWPEKMIDHKDRDRTNNSWDNLREADAFENSRNAVKRTDNTSGIKGVSWHKGHEKWCVTVCYGLKKFHGGYFEELEAAKAAAITLRERLHRDFSCDG